MGLLSINYGTGKDEMTPQQLIRRDLPLSPGRRLRFAFTVVYEVSLDDEVLQGEPSASLAEIEEWLGDKYGMDEALWKTLEQNYDHMVIEHETTLADYNHTLEEAPVPGLPYARPRFEVSWEQREREAGHQDSWPSRAWLQAIPSPSAGASA